jgi:predicted nuclease of predicted toxin-antitoxin system
MRLIVDESAGQAVLEYLRAAGHDVLAVAEVMPQADDREILERAASDQRILITNDKDFGELVFRSQRAAPGIVLFRLRDEHPANRVRTVAALLEQHAERLAGRFTVATEDSVRIRPLHRPT